MIAIAPKQIALATMAATPARRRVAPDVSISTLDRRFRPEHLAYCVVRFNIRPADEIEAVRHRGKHAIERFLDRLGLTGKVEDQRAAADDAYLSRKNGGRHVPQADLAHLLAESRQQLVRDRERGLGRDVAWRGAGAAGRQYQGATNGVDELDQGAFDKRLLVRNEPRLHAPWRGERRGEPFLKSRDALVLVHAGRGAIADRHQSDQQLLRFAHAMPVRSALPRLCRCASIIRPRPKAR